MGNAASLEQELCCDQAAGAPGDARTRRIGTTHYESESANDGVDEEVVMTIDRRSTGGTHGGGSVVEWF